jgi:hypothetical protein
MKNVIVVNSRTSGKSTVVTEATTWGTLKDQLISAGTNMENMVAVVRETKNTLDQPDAILPTEDFTIFLLAQQQKGGIDTNSLFTLAKSVDGICDDLNNAQEAIGKIVVTGKAFAVAATSFGEVMQDANEKITVMQDAVGRLIGGAMPPVMEKAVFRFTPEEASKLVPILNPLPSVPEPNEEKSAKREYKKDKSPTPTDKQVEVMKAEAKRLGLKVVCKTGKSHPSYNREYKHAYDKAVLAGEVSPEKPVKLPKVEPAKPKDTTDDDLMKEMAELKNSFRK